MVCSWLMVYLTVLLTVILSVAIVTVGHLAILCMHVVYTTFLLIKLNKCKNHFELSTFTILRI